MPWPIIAALAGPMLGMASHFLSKGAEPHYTQASTREIPEWLLPHLKKGVRYQSRLLRKHKLALRESLESPSVLSDVFANMAGGGGQALLASAPGGSHPLLRSLIGTGLMGLSPLLRGVGAEPQRRLSLLSQALGAPAGAMSATSGVGNLLGGQRFTGGQQEGGGVDWRSLAQATAYGLAPGGPFGGPLESLLSFLK